jgi:hypothetical protein
MFRFHDLSYSNSGASSDGQLFPSSYLARATFNDSFHRFNPNPITEFWSGFGGLNISGTRAN